MKIPRALPIVCALSALVVPASASAGDPLLSGYGGPGAGDQALLGSVRLPAGRSPDPDPVRDPAGARAFLASAPVAPPLSSTPRAPTAPARSGSTRRPRNEPTRTARRSPSSPTSPARTTAPRAATRTIRAASTPLLPFDGERILVVLLIVLGVSAAGVASARLGRPA